MLDATTSLFESEDPNAVFYSSLLTGVIGHGVTYSLMAFEKLVLKKGLLDQTPKLLLVVELVFYLLAFLAMNATWRTYWAVLLNFYIANYICFTFKANFDQRFMNSMFTSLNRVTHGPIFCSQLILALF